jgi:hypothetical protein
MENLESFLRMGKRLLAFQMLQSYCNRMTNQTMRTSDGNPPVHTLEDYYAALLMTERAQYCLQVSGIVALQAMAKISKDDFFEWVKSLDLLSEPIDFAKNGEVRTVTVELLADIMQSEVPEMLKHLPIKFVNEENK